MSNLQTLLHSFHEVNIPFERVRVKCDNRRTWLPSGFFWTHLPDKRSSTSCVYNNSDCWGEGNISSSPSMNIYIINANFYVCLLGCMLPGRLLALSGRVTACCLSRHPPRTLDGNTLALRVLLCVSIANPQKALMGTRWESVKKSPTWSNTYFVFYQEGRCFC